MVPSYQGSMLIAAATKLRRMDQFKLSVLLWSRMGENRSHLAWTKVQRAVAARAKNSG
jgi:hypothetical protein